MMRYSGASRQVVIRRPGPRIRPTAGKGRMNGLEKRWADQLEMQKTCGMILAWSFESVGLRLADRTFYFPDFLVVTHDHFELHECKGHWEDDARVKFKVAAELYPHFIWKAMMWNAKRKEWKIEEL